MPVNFQTHSLERAVSGEREAHTLRLAGKVEEAFKAFDEAARLYRDASEHFKAAVCYASAATCWNIGTGWQPLRNAATRTHLAAREALKAAHFDYARQLFGDAALLYEKEGDFAKYSECFYSAKRSDGSSAWHLFVSGHKDEGEAAALSEAGWRDRGAAIARWALNTLHCLVWGYGERPARTFAAGFVVILVSAIAYLLSGEVAVGNSVRAVSFTEGLYMSVVTFTTVGFGDYLPLGWARVFAMLEALSGITLVPLFIVSLTRRYLRMS